MRKIMTLIPTLLRLFGTLGLMMLRLIAAFAADEKKPPYSVARAEELYEDDLIGPQEYMRAVRGGDKQY